MLASSRLHDRHMNSTYKRAVETCMVNVHRPLGAPEEGCTIYAIQILVAWSSLV